MPGDNLSTYRKKRDFKITSEPKGEMARAGKALSFVIQKHAASRLHYDFRLELEGTLKSWAVPKGPSLDPKVRRMAVHVEDHPLSYGGFEGVIPKGQYGAGTVIVWDRGTWEPIGDPREGYRNGKLKFEMHGEKLRGRWNLVRIDARRDERQEPWLLIKENDEEARPASEYDVVEALPDSVLGGTRKDREAKKMKAKATRAKPRASAKSQSAAIPEGAAKAKLPVALFPQLATLVDEVPGRDGWIYELKFDGYRIVARIEGDDVRLFTRNGNDWTGKMKPLADELGTLGLASAWLDGEAVVMNAKGMPDFQLLQNAFDSSKTKDIVFFVFDMPHFGGYDLTRVPLVERRALLQKVLENNASSRIRFSEAFDVDPDELLENACKRGLEGLIAKRADAPYASTRSTSWVKIKCTKRQEFVVAGFTDPKGSRVGFGSLLLGVHDGQGELRYAGNVGTGFADASLRELYAKLKALETDKDPFVDRPRSVKGHWVRPRLVAEVAFTEWTSDGRIRHPVFHGLRTDKDPQAITREREKHLSAKVSHGERVVDPSTKATKLDVVNYYASIAKHMLPHLVGRPVALVRAPTGITGQVFFQKHTRGRPAMIELETPETLVAAAQMNVIEIHTGNSTIRDIAHPDRVIFDMDPGEGVDWATLKEATSLMKKMLDMLGLASFLKTSGGKGLHVVVPLTPSEAWDYDRVKDFSAAVVKHMARTLPKLFVVKSGPRNRIGKIFIDFLRNGKGATTIAAFSVRARPGLGVSVPLAWKELAGLQAANQWNIFNIHERLKKLKADPWKAYAGTKQTLDDALQRLEA